MRFGRCATALLFIVFSSPAYSLEVHSFLGLENDMLWLFLGRDQGVVLYNTDTKSIVAQYPTGDGDNDVYEYPMFIYYLGDRWFTKANGGLIRFSDSGQTTYPEIGYITTWAVDNNNRLLVGKENGLLVFDGTNWSTIEFFNGRRVRCFGVSPHYENKDIWVGTEVGLYQYDGSKWVDYTTDSGLKANRVTGVLLDYNDVPWVSTWGRLTINDDTYLQYRNGDTWIEVESGSFPGPYIDPYVPVLVFPDNIVWYEMYSGLKSNEGIHLTGQYGVGPFTLASNWYKDSHGTFWGGGYDDKLWKFDGISFTPVPIETPTAVGDERPGSFVLTISNYPNPFNPSTTIHFDIPEAGKTTLAVYTVAGRKVAVLADGFMEAGPHEALFDGSGLASGIYLARLTTGKHTATAKITLAK